MALKVNNILKEPDLIESTKFIMRLMVLVDMMESEMMDFSEFLDKLGHLKYDRKQHIKKIISDCKTLVKENDVTLSVESATHFGEYIDLLRDHFYKSFETAFIIDDKDENN